MAVEDIGHLHNQYVGLSNRFRAAWAFDQYLTSLRKVFLQGTSPRLPGDLQEIYNEIKSISQQLNQPDSDRLQRHLASLEGRLDRIGLALLAEDSKVSPNLLRQFFQRVKNQDEKIVVQIVRFYLYSSANLDWPDDRLDKADFLLTRIAGERDLHGQYLLSDPHRVREIGHGLWSLIDADEPSPETIQERSDLIEAIRDEVAASERLDALNDQGVVARYRDIKHTLGAWFFHPDLLQAILTTNLVIKNLVTKLSQLEERRIVADYQRIFELEREVPTDGELDAELSTFREDIEAFEKQLASGELKLDELGQVRRRVRSLTDRLTLAATGHDTPLTSEVAETSTESAAEPQAHVLIDDAYRRLVASLDEADPEAPPKRVVLTSELFSFRLEAREVSAFRRLNHPLIDGEEKALERFILQSAALRLRLNEDAEEIRGLLDETANTGDAPIFSAARKRTRLASTYLSHFGCAIEHAISAGRLDQAQDLQILRMRLMRDYAGSWLLADKPMFRTR